MATCPALPPALFPSNQFYDTNAGDDGNVTCQTSGGGQTNGGCSFLSGGNPEISADVAVQVAFSLDNVGCSSWDACTFAWASGPTFTGVMGPSIGNDDSGEPCEGCYYAGAITRTQADESYRVPCCFGSISDVRCDPTWCPSDPAGSCTDLFAAACLGSSSCGRHKYLTPSYTSDQDGAPCNTWYLNVKDNAVTGAYADGALSLSLDPMVAVDAEIARFCGAEGATSGECSCYNAYVACTPANAGEGGCLIAGVAGGEGRGVARRVDVYCNAAFSTSSADGSWFTFSDETCGPNVGYGSPTLNSSSSNPYVPPGGVDPFPLHCWLPQCQQQTDDCIFKSIVDLQRACPPICLQFASAANVIIDGTTTPAVTINVNQISCGTWDGISSVSQAPFLWPASEMALEVPAGYATSFTIPLTNTSIDSATSYDSMSVNLFSTIEPIVVLPAAAGNPLGLPNNSATDMWVVVDAGGLLEGQSYGGLIAATDATNANAPGILAFFLDIVPSDRPAAVTLSADDSFNPPVVPSSRGIGVGVGLEGGRVQGYVPPPPGAWGQVRVPTQRPTFARVAKTTPNRGQAEKSAKHGGDDSTWILLLVAAVLLLVVVFLAAIGAAVYGGSTGKGSTGSKGGNGSGMPVASVLTK